MKRLVYATLLSVGVWGASSGAALAQLGSYQRPQLNPHPTVSPYVNMAGVYNPATNYYGIVRPQMQNMQNIQQLQQQYQTLETSTIPMLGASMYNQGQTQGQGMPGLLMTGHPVMFGYTNIYFPGVGNRMAGGMNGGTSPFPTFNRR